MRRPRHLRVPVQIECTRLRPRASASESKTGFAGQAYGRIIRRSPSRGTPKVAAPAARDLSRGGKLMKLRSAFLAISIGTLVACLTGAAYAADSKCGANTGKPASGEPII